MTGKNEIIDPVLTEAIDEFHNLVGHLAKVGLTRAIPDPFGVIFAEALCSDEDGKLFPFEGKAGYSLSLGIMRAPGHADDGLLDVLCELTHTAATTEKARPAFTFAKRTGQNWRAVLTDVNLKAPSALLGLAETVGMRPHDGSVELDHEHLLLGLKRSVAIFATGD